MIVRRKIQHITSPFGMRWGRLHKGVDLRIMNDSFTKKLHVLLPEDCNFLRAVYQKKWGWTYVFKGNDSGNILKFIHMKKRGFVKDAIYHKNYIIGHTVVTEYMQQKKYADHLHFETWKFKVPFNPVKYFKKMGIEYD